MPIVIETAQEFALRHGGKPVEIMGEDGSSTGRCIFPDCAQWRAENTDVRREPPEDRWDLLWLKKAYFSQLRRRARDDFNKLRNEALESVALAQQYSNLPYPAADIAGELLRLKALVEGYESELEKIEAELENSPEAQKKRQQEEYERRRFEKIAVIKNEIMAIEL